MKAPRLLLLVAAFPFLLAGTAGAQQPAPQQWPTPQGPAPQWPMPQGPTLLAPAQQPATPAYIKADRSALQGFLEANAIDYIFSDKLTADRRTFILRSLQRIPAPGCPANPSFTLTRVGPIERGEKGTIWLESFEIDCNPKIRRTRAFLATNENATSLDLVPGETRTHASPSVPISVQNDAVTDLSRHAVIAGPQGCSEKPLLRDTRFVATVSQSPVEWKERWLFRVCEKDVELDVTFFNASPNSLSPQGGAMWAVHFPARDVRKPPAPGSVVPKPVPVVPTPRSTYSPPVPSGSFR